jgi:hypothetical protein
MGDRPSGFRWLRDSQNTGGQTGLAAKARSRADGANGKRAEIDIM